MAIVVAGAMFAGVWLYNAQNPANENEKTVAENQQAPATNVPLSELEAIVLPAEGVVLPVIWGDLGAKLVSVGAIDEIRFKALYSEREQFTKEYEKLFKTL